jgi:hypothetical protein
LAYSEFQITAPPEIISHKPNQNSVWNCKRAVTKEEQFRKKHTEQTSNYKGHFIRKSCSCPILKQIRNFPMETPQYKEALTNFCHVKQILDAENLLYSLILYMIDKAEDSNPPRVGQKQWSSP